MLDISVEVAATQFTLLVNICDARVNGGIAHSRHNNIRTMFVTAVKRLRIIVPIRSHLGNREKKLIRYMQISLVIKGKN